MFACLFTTLSPSSAKPQLQLLRLNPNQAGGGGGANMPHRFSNAYSSGTKGRIDLNPGCTFKFVRCQFGP